jgi:hypothetical protein
MEDAAFGRDRMHEAVCRLGGQLREVKAQEEQARRRAAYDAALVERDKLAKELVAVYPAMTEQLADLAGRIAANDAAIERVNQKLPDGKRRSGWPTPNWWRANSKASVTAQLTFRGSRRTCGCRHSSMPRSTRTRGRRPEDSCPSRRYLFVHRAQPGAHHLCVR